MSAAGPPKKRNVVWCCMCGEHNPEPLEVCPVSERRMGEGRGLSHLLAYGAHEQALRVWADDERFRDKGHSVAPHPSGRHSGGGA